MMFLALALCSLVAGTGVREGATEVWSQTLADGSRITIERFEELVHVEAKPPDGVELPAGLVPLAGKAMRYDYVGRVRREGGESCVFWRKRHSVPVLPVILSYSELHVWDVTLLGARAAVLYSHRTVNLDVTEQQDDGAYSVSATHEVMAQTDALGGVVAGRLVWLKGLYLLLETTGRDEEIWLIANGEPERVFRREDVWP